MLLVELTDAFIIYKVFDLANFVDLSFCFCLGGRGLRKILLFQFDVV